MSRRKAREGALKALFEVDVGRVHPKQAIAHVAGEDGLSPDEAQFLRELVEGTLAHLAEIDGHLSRLAVDWRLDRMARIDRNVLRLGAFELLHRPDTPASVAINEAVELAKIYGGPDSGRFVNGILGALARQRAHSEGGA